MKYSYMAGVAVSLFFVVLGICSIVYFFTMVYNGPDSNSVFGGRYLLAGGLCIVLGIRMLWITIPAFIPIKHNSLPAVSTCPYCGAIIEADSTQCKKCQKELN